jgi:peptide deformylase
LTSPLAIVNYPHPTLRHPSKALRRVDAQLVGWIREMFEIMYAHEGVGLAANQVDLPYRFFVMNPTGDRERTDQEMVFLNPVLSRHKGSAEAEEGCLSLPKLFAQVKRPEQVVVNAYNLRGQEFEMEASGLVGRVIQHETDHLDGILFIDRLGEAGMMTVRPSLLGFEQEFIRRRERGEIQSDEVIAERLRNLEQERT